MRTAAVLVPLSLLVAASAPAQPDGEPLDAQLQQARAEQAAADAQAGKLQHEATQARDEAGRLRAQEDAAAAAIDAAEARITTADAEVRLAAAYVAAHQQRLAEQQQPVSSLLVGLALMARRPPLLVLAGGGGSDELVKVRLLLDSTLPVIRARTGEIAAELAKGERLQQSALAARDELVRSRQALAGRRQQFAALEREAVERSLETGGAALGASDIAIAAGETLAQLGGEQSNSASIRALAGRLADEQPSPLRPLAPEAAASMPPFAYRLPAHAPVSEGLGAVNSSGIRSRGVTLATPRGAAIAAPGDGIVKFAGPFGDYDGVLIIDHGRGWMSLIVNVGPAVRPGNRVRLGDALGRALGPVEVELSHNGRRFSPALIAGSSASLSKGEKGG